MGKPVNKDKCVYLSAMYLHVLQFEKIHVENFLVKIFSFEHLKIEHGESIIIVMCAYVYVQPCSCSSICHINELL